MTRMPPKPKCDFTPPRDGRVRCPVCGSSVPYTGDGGPIYMDCAGTPEQWALHVQRKAVVAMRKCRPDCTRTDEQIMADVRRCMECARWNGEIRCCDEMGCPARWPNWRNTLSHGLDAAGCWRPRHNA